VSGTLLVNFGGSYALSGGGALTATTKFTDNATVSVSGGAVTAGSARWLLAEGALAATGTAQPSVVVFNRGAATDVNVTLLFEDGPEASVSFPVAAGARLTVPMDQFGDLAGRRYSVLVEGATPSASLVVERDLAAPGAAQRSR
jgi:hypothetical protein